MANEDQSPGDYFPLDLIPVGMQLGMYEYLNDWTLNEVRKVDRLRRRLVDANPRLLEKQRLIPKVTVRGGRNNFDILTLKFYDYCKCSKDERRNKITLYFDTMMYEVTCLKGTRRCNRCDSLSERHFPSTSPVIGLSLEECYPLVTKGSKIEELTLKRKFSREAGQEIRHFVDSSLGLLLERCEFKCTSLFMKLVKEPRKLRVYFHDSQLLDDEFFRTAAHGSLMLRCADRTLDHLPLTDDQLGILAARSNLTDISIGHVDGVTAEGVQSAIQILLHSPPKCITMIMERSFIDKDDLKEMPELDVESVNSDNDYDSDSDNDHDFDRQYNFKYLYGGGKVEVLLHIYHYDYCEIKMSSHKTSLVA